MAKIVRYNGNLQAFASAAPGTERTIFGDVTQANDLTSQINADFLRGWGIVGPSDQPSLEDFNGAMYTHGQLHAYLHQIGVPEYSALQEYHQNSLCNSGGVLYVSLINNNIGNTPESSPSQWRELYAQTGHGQCRLTRVSGTQIRLNRYNGSGLIIGGVTKQIPAAGVNMSNAGLNGSVLYYVYAYLLAGVVTLEAVTTGHATDATTGVEIKSGDPSRTLVGMLYTDPSAQFMDTPVRRLLANWFNRRKINCAITTTGAISFTTTVPTNISSALDLEFLTWGDEAIEVRSTGQHTNDTATQSVGIIQYVDNAAWGFNASTYIVQSGAGFCFTSSNVQNPVTSLVLTEGRHTAQVYGAVTSGTGTVNSLSHSATPSI